jgi:hypothetical protein
VVSDKAFTAFLGGGFQQQASPSLCSRTVPVPRAEQVLLLVSTISRGLLYSITMFSNSVCLWHFSKVGTDIAVLHGFIHSLPQKHASLSSSYSVTAVVYLFVSRSLLSIGCICQAIIVMLQDVCKMLQRLLLHLALQPWVSFGLLFTKTSII